MARVLPQLQGKPNAAGGPTHLHTPTQAVGVHGLVSSRRRRLAVDPQQTHIVVHADASQALKKIINSLAEGRSASDAALLASGGRLNRAARDPNSNASPAVSAAGTPVFAPTIEPARDTQGDLDALPPGAEPPAPTSVLLGGPDANGTVDARNSFKAHRDAFFFLLARELEKVSTKA